MSPNRCPERASPALFSVLGVRPTVGQPFTASDAIPGGQRRHDQPRPLEARFGGDLAIVGKLLTLNGQPFTVTGVMPPGFAFPRGAELPPAMSIWRATRVDAARLDPAIPQLWHHEPFGRGPAGSHRIATCGARNSAGS